MGRIPQAPVGFGSQGARSEGLPRERAPLMEEEGVQERGSPQVLSEPRSAKLLNDVYKYAGRSRFLSVNVGKVDVTIHTTN